MPKYVFNCVLEMPFGVFLAKRSRNSFRSVGVLFADVWAPPPFSDFTLTLGPTETALRLDALPIALAAGRFGGMIGQMFIRPISELLADSVWKM